MNNTIADTSSQDTYLSPRRNTRLWVMGVVAIVVVLALLITTIPMFLRWLSSEDSVSLDRLRIAEVVRGNFVRDISVQGKVVASISPTLYTSGQAWGTITFEVSAGDVVQKGDRLAVLGSPELTNQLQQAESLQSKLQVAVERDVIEGKQKRLTNQKTVDLANLALTAARRELRRADLAFKGGALKEVDLQKAQDDVESAEYSYQHAIADTELDKEKLSFESRTRQLELDQQNLQVDKLKRQVGELVIVSPVSGIVGNRLVEQKAEVGPNTAVLSVVDLTQFEVEAEVPQNYADDMTVGMSAEIIAGTATYGAQVISISPEIILDEVTTRLRFAGDPPAGLRQNQRLTTRVLLETKNDVLMLPRGQFLESGSGRFAFRVDDDIAYKQTISVGARSLSQVEIVSGLDEGDRVIISGTDLFDDADTVLIND